MINSNQGSLKVMPSDRIKKNRQMPPTQQKQDLSRFALIQFGLPESLKWPHVPVSLLCFRQDKYNTVCHWLHSCVAIVRNCSFVVGCHYIFDKPLSFLEVM